MDFSLLGLAALSRGGLTFVNQQHILHDCPAGLRPSPGYLHHWAHLDRSELGTWNPGGDRYCLVKITSFDEVIAAKLLFSFRKRAIDGGGFAVAHSNGG